MRAVFLAALLAARAFGQAGSDAITELNEKIRTGAVQLPYDEAHGYLQGVLDALHVPVESQMLVFSKTSSQGMRIEPKHPRALYFNDSVSVGWVHGGLLEVMTQNAQGEMAFYTADQRAWVHRERAAKAEPIFERRQDCLHCHSKGTVLLSVFPAGDGVPVDRLGFVNTDHRTPMEKLWGGWYVTGVSSAPKHMGNGTVRDTAAVKLEEMRERFDPAGYISPYSDIVALMVFEHQMHMMNLLATAHTADNAKELVDYLLFVDEPVLGGEVKSTSGFTERFASEGLRDGKGRSLRELDLKQRLMRYPCSYMIYSEAFECLPAARKQAIYSRMWRVLSSGEKDLKYARLSVADRRAIVEILRGTKKDLPAYFQ